METDEKTIAAKDLLDTLNRAVAEGMDICIDYGRAEYDPYAAWLDGIPLQFAKCTAGTDGAVWLEYKNLRYRLHLERRVEVPFVELMNKTAED